MADLATLGVVVTSKGVNEAKQGLDNLAKSGQRAEREVAKVPRTFKQAELSARQLIAAQRQLPAQFTDIFTSLQGGQKPLQVLIQQGGQLKDVFGGVRPALQASLGYIISLINPLTVAAAAVVALGVAWRQGSQEAVEFNKALILTGNSAGTTADALADAAARIDEVAGTQRSAASALVAVASTGRFTAEQVEQVALAAEQLRIATGKSIEDTVAEFVKLEGDPVRAILKLNETQNFLTLEIYEQIKSLQDLGREQDAAALAISTYANEIGRRTGEIEQNLGFLETAWNSVKWAASEAWDAMLSIGRESTAAEQIAQLQESIAAVQNREGPFYRDLTDEAADRIIARFQAQIDKIQGAQTQAAEEAAKEGAIARATAAAIALDQEAAGFATAEEKRAQAIIAARNKADAAIRDAQAAGRADLVAGIQADLQKIIAGINRPAEEAAAREAESAARRAAAEARRRAQESERERQRTLDAGIKAEQALNQTILKNAADLAGPAAQAARAYADEQLRLVTIQEQLAAAGLLDAEAERQLAIAREQNTAVYEKRLKAISEQKTQTELLIADMEFELRLMGLSNAEREREIALRYAGAEATDEQKKKIEELADSLRRSREAAAALDDFRASFEDSVASVLDGSKSIKDAFEDFADAIIAQLARIVAQNLTASLFGQQGQTGSGSFGGSLFDFFGSFLGRGRAVGGPVTGNRLYPVSENGQPEVLEMYGRKYLIPGGDGEVTPLSEAGGSGQATVVNQVIQVTGTITQKSAYQIQREAQLRQNAAVRR